MQTILVIVLSYLFGSVPWALIIGKLFFHKDIRLEGSGNLGASNAGRVLGKPVAVIVTVLDALKAFFSMLLAHYLAPGTEIYAGLACCIGHCFPIFAQFKGGKAVATSYGFLLGIAALLTGEYLLQFVLPAVSFFVILSKGIDISIPIALLVLWVFVTYRHRSNLERVKNGTESKVKWMG